VLNLQWAWLDFMRWAGKLANLVGIPGLVRDGDYEFGALSIGVAVSRREYHTVITVNGVNVYFHRLTGSILGVSAAEPCGSQSGSFEESTGSALRLMPRR